MSEISPAIKVDLEISVSVGDQRKIRTVIQLEGEADVVARVSSAVTAVITAAVGPVVAPPPAPGITPAVVEILSAPYVVPIVQAVTAIPAPVAENSHRQSVLDRPRPSKLAQRDWSKFSLGFGALLITLALAAAVIFPPVVPRAQRVEVFMMSLAFGLLGTLALYSGALGGKGSLSTDLSGRATRPIARHTDSGALRLQRAALLRQSTSRPMGPALGGIAFGTMFIVAGAIAPFALDTGNADERFLMMLGFAPVIVVGVLLVTVFWRRISRPSKNPAGMIVAATSAPLISSAPRTVRAPVTRAPDDAAFKLAIPAALAALGVILLVVIGLVAVATIMPLLR